ncbi:MAG: DUF4118 domain-containing protein [Thermoanaerobaculia bacterium]
MRIPSKGVASWLVALLLIAVVTTAGRLLDANPGAVGFAYLIAVLLISLRSGLLVGTISSIAATLCYNFFFFPPLYTFTIAEPANWLALLAFLVCSVTVNRLIVTARTKAREAEASRAELQALYGLSIDLFAATSRVGVLGEAAQRALTLLGASEGGLVLFAGSRSRQQEVVWTGERFEEIEELIAGVGRHKRQFEISSSLGRDVYLPLNVGGKTIGVLVARGTAATNQALESVSHLVAMAVERERFVEQTAHIQALRESDALKTSLLRAISHDLTTPITAVGIRIESLRRESAGNARMTDDVDVIAEETSRLRRRIDNLLAMARLEAGKAQPHREPTPPADLFRALRENLPLVFAARPVSVRVDPECPDALVDPSLALEILVNLVENAHRASPAGTGIELAARRSELDSGKIRIEILDRGPGLPPEMLDGEGSVSHQRTDVAQRGLGLEIARNLAIANGGSISLAPRPAGGTIARIDLAAAEVPTTTVEADVETEVP